MTTKTAAPERRHFSRAPWPGGLGINLLQPQGVIPVDRVNMSEGGLCLRLPTMLEVRSLVRLQLTPARGISTEGLRMVECTGRVAWVTQRLDLRDMPPYLFDVGIELVDLPRRWHRWFTQQDGSAVPMQGRSSGQGKGLEPAAINGRWFVPRLERVGAREGRWHLVVTVEDAPCFSQRFPTERAALVAWARFKRGQAKTRKAMRG